MLPITRTSRRMIAVLTAMLLLLCQAALAARACANYLAPAAKAAASCHDGMGKADPAAPLPETMPACAPALSAEGPSLSIVAVTALPALLLAAPAPATPNARERDTPARHARGRPPPLTVLHCRFLN